MQTISVLGAEQIECMVNVVEKQALLPGVRFGVQAAQGYLFYFAVI